LRNIQRDCGENPESLAKRTNGQPTGELASAQGSVGGTPTGATGTVALPENSRPIRRRHFVTCENRNSRYIELMPDQAQKNRPAAPGGGGGGDGPSSPKIEKPNTEELLKRMRKVDPDQAKRYRQRTGQ